MTLVSGGVRSGKSRHAEALLRPRDEVTYLACARVADAEFAARVAHHRATRPASWTTLESLDVVAAVGMPGGPLLLECLGTWLTGLVDEADLWADLGAAATLVADRSRTLVAALIATDREVVIVTNEVGWSLVPLTPAGRFFQDELGRLNAAVAAIAERVHLVVAGRVLDLSGAPRVDG